MKHTRQWFRNRLGKTVYRKPIEGCDCSNCTGTLIIIHKQPEEKDKYFHADYLYSCQNEMDIHYQDKPVCS